MAVQHLVKTYIHTNTSDNHTQVNHIFNSIGAKMSIDKLIETEPHTWNVSVSKEVGGMAQGMRNVKGNDVLQFLPRDEIPQD